MKNLLKLFATLIMMYVLYSCESSSNPDEDDPPIVPDDSMSYVLDASGRPVAGAKIVYTLDVNVYESDTSHVILDHLPEVTAMNFTDSIEIRYNTEFEDNISIWVENDIWCIEDTIIVIENDRLDSGDYTFYWDKKDSDGKHVTNDAYQIWKSGGNVWESPYYNFYRVIYNYQDASENEIQYLAATDSAGKFDLNEIKLPEYWEPVYSESDSTGSSDIIGYRRFSEYVRLWAVKDGMENIYLDSVRLGYDKAVTIKPSSGK
jgi:hypothetical protein